MYLLAVVLSAASLALCGAIGFVSTAAPPASEVARVSAGRADSRGAESKRRLPRRSPLAICAALGRCWRLPAAGAGCC